MRQAFMLLGIMTFIVFVGAFIAFEQAEAPVAIPDQSERIQELMKFTLTSPAFAEGERIPQVYTCDGDNINPELRIDGIPEGTKSLVLLMDDPDIPESVKASRGIEKFNHWVLYNIPSPPAGETLVIPVSSQVGVSGLTSRGTPGYVGPCPPDREHRYMFRLYALPELLEFPQSPTLDEVEARAKERALGLTELMGRYERMK